jgi:hypothetical protein
VFDIYYQPEAGIPKYTHSTTAAGNHVTLTRVGTLTENLAGTLSESLYLSTHKRFHVHTGVTYTSAWLDTAGVLQTSSYTPTDGYFDSDQWAQDQTGADPAWMAFVGDFTEAALDAFVTMVPLMVANLVVPGSGIVFLLEVGYGVMGVQWGYDLGQALYALGTGTDPNTGRELTKKEYASLVAGLLGGLVGGAVAVFAIRATDVIGTRIQEVAAGERCGIFSSCFVAGTPMDVVGGSKPIEQVKDAEAHGPQSDLIWSRSQFDPDGPIVARRVLRKFVRVSPVLNLHVGGRRIGTTREHPFYADGKGWTPAGELVAGDRVLLKSGDWLRVDGVADGGRVETVYNLEVEGDHTYFVGGAYWGFAVWAHNADCNIEKVGDEYVLRDRTTGKVIERASERSVLVASAKSKGLTVAPNPHGKAGSPPHQAVVDEVVRDIENRDLRAQREVEVKTVDGVKETRVMDVVARDPVTQEIVEVHQVGRSLKSDTQIPVSRERTALRDVRHSPELRNARRFFHRYIPE